MNANWLTYTNVNYVFNVRGTNYLNMVHISVFINTTSNVNDFIPHYLYVSF